MKTRTFEVEVVTTSSVLVTLPETYDSPEVIAKWERGLWELENGIEDIAEYAARMAVYAPSGQHDGIGEMITNGYTKPDYEKNKYQVVAIVKDEDTETTTTELSPTTA